MINLIKDKLGINTEEIQLDFNFHPLPYQNQIIREWVKNSEGPRKVEISFKKSDNTHLNKVGLFYGTLDLMNRARTNQSKKLERKRPFNSIRL